MGDNNIAKIDNAFDDESLEEYIDKQKKKSAKKKRRIISTVAIVGVIIIAIIVISNIISENNKKKAMEEVTASVSDIAEKYDIDLVCTKEIKNNLIMLDSESFANLSAENMNSVLMDLQEEKGYDVDLGDVQILSQGHRYKVKVVRTGYEYISDSEDLREGLKKYKNITSNITYESGYHILALDDEKMTCDIIGKYTYSSDSSSSSSKSDSVPAGKKLCSRCSGTGRVTKHFGKSWNKQSGYGYGDVCGACDGTGYVDE